MQESEFTKDEDGNLFKEVIEVLHKQKELPKLVIFENVEVFYHRKMKTEYSLRRDFFRNEKNRIFDKYQLLNASDYGVPSNRYRVFIVCQRLTSSKPLLFQHQTYSQTK